MNAMCFFGAKVLNKLYIEKLLYFEITDVMLYYYCFSNKILRLSFIVHHSKMFQDHVFKLEKFSLDDSNIRKRKYKGA